MFGGVKSQIINTLHPTKNQETITTTNHKATSLRTFSSDLEIIIEVLVLQSCFESWIYIEGQIKRVKYNHHQWRWKSLKLTDWGIFVFLKHKN